uniref:Uncharacterized protein n=1 Tax=Hyaloperonospora arabidopsidis (strain Emoy2) TaxID=559515 RepID=M4BZ12_HYAAE
MDCSKCASSSACVTLFSYLFVVYCTNNETWNWMSVILLIVNSIWVVLGFEHERELNRRAVDDVVKHERVRAASRVADRHQVHEVLGTRALGILPLCEQSHGLRSSDGRLERGNHPSHHIVERWLLDPPSINLLVIIALGGATQIVSEQVDFNVLRPQQSVRR